MSKLSQIIDGWAHVFNRDPVREKLAMERAKICASCPMIEKGTIFTLIKDEAKEIEGMKCGECGCPLSAATRSKDYNCPKGRW